jgi:hypothetical protein
LALVDMICSTTSVRGLELLLKIAANSATPSAGFGPLFSTEAPAIAATDVYLQWKVYSVNRYASGHPSGMPLVARMLASSKQVCEPMASSSAKYNLKTSTEPVSSMGHPVPLRALHVRRDQPTRKEAVASHLQCCDVIHGDTCQKRITPRGMVLDRAGIGC